MYRSKPPTACTVCLRNP